MALTKGLSRMSGRLSCPVLRGRRRSNALLLPDWGGFTTHDLKRCRLIARMVALIYNGWNLFVRLSRLINIGRDYESTVVVAWGRDLNPTWGPDAFDYYEPTREAGGHPGGADPLGGLLEFTQIDCS